MAGETHAGQQPSQLSLTSIVYEEIHVWQKPPIHIQCQQDLLFIGRTKSIPPLVAKHAESPAMQSTGEGWMWEAIEVCTTPNRSEREKRVRWSAARGYLPVLPYLSRYNAPLYSLYRTDVDPFRY